MIKETQLNEDVKRQLYQIGDLIFSEGSLGRDFYIVEKGQVEIFKKDASGHKVRIHVVEPGEAFGEFALLDKKPRSASARAISDLVLIQVSEKGYEQLIADLPPWAISMMKSFISRLRMMNDQLTDKQFIKK